MSSIIITIEQDAEEVIDWAKSELSVAAKAVLSIIVKDSTVAIKALKETSLGTDFANIISAGVAATGGSVPAIETLVADFEKAYADFETGGGLVGLWNETVSIALALGQSIYDDFVATLPKTA